ncbi:MAG: secondary thiamine-phosphate synthase enzyme YjbQ [Pseudomonadota bacterium]
MIRRQLTIATTGRGFFEITDELRGEVDAAGVLEGLCHCFIHHTSASLLIMENADPAVLRDLERFFADLVPDGDRRFEHDAEGPDDMPAHVRSALTATDLTLPVRAGRLDLGTWQGVFVYEHRYAPHRRRISLSVF